MPRTSPFRLIAVGSLLATLSTTGACSEPTASAASSVPVPESGIETHINAGQANIDCQGDCIPVLVIDVHQFPDSVNGLQIETTPSGASAEATVSRKHFKSHDGGGSFMVPLDKADLVKGYDLKIKPIYKAKATGDKAITTVDEIKVEAIRNTEQPQ